MIAYAQANKILNRYFGNVSDSITSNLYVGLSITPINPDGTGATEPSGGGYARIIVANNKTSFTTASNGILYNAIELSFPESTTSWGNITHIFISDTAGGAPIYYDALTAPRAVQSQTVLLFAPNSIQIKMTSV